MMHPIVTSEVSVYQLYEALVDATEGGTALEEIVSLEREVAITDIKRALLVIVQGKWLDDIIREAEEEGNAYGSRACEQAQERIKESLGRWVGRSTLYKRRVLYRQMMDSLGSLEAIAEWVVTRFRENGRLTLTAIEKTFIQHLPPAQRYGGEENAAEALVNMVEQAGSAIEQAAGLSLAGAGEGSEFALSAATAGIETLGSIHSRIEGLDPFSDYELYDVGYENWIRSLPCVFTGDDQVDLFHVFSDIMGAKRGSYVTLPVCRSLHNEFHQTGFDSFSLKYGYLWGETKVPWYRLLFEHLSTWVRIRLLSLSEVEQDPP